MRHNNSLLIYVGLAASFVPFSGAQTPPDSGGEDVLSPVRVTASRLPQAGESPGDIVSLPRGDIEARGFSAASELLRGLPGLDHTRQGGRGGLDFLSIRGGDENFTQILIDGVKVNDPTDSRGGSFDLSLLDPALIEQIDIVRGGLSPVHGADALSGIVAVTMRAPAQSLKQSARLAYGSDEEAAANWVARGPLAGGGGAIGAAWLEGADSVEGDSFERLQVSAQYRRDLADSVEFSLFALHANADSTSFPETSGGPRLAVLRELEFRAREQTHAQAALSAGDASESHVSTTLSWSRSETALDNPGIADGEGFAVPPFSDETRFERTEAVVNGVLALSRPGPDRIGADISLGGAYLSEHGTSDGVIDFGFPVLNGYRLKRDTFSVFSEFALTPLADLAINAGMRYDNADGPGSETTLRAHGRYRFRSGGPLISLDWGEGFKLPSFFALGSPLVGNPSLVPEKSENLSVSLAQPLASGSEIRLTGFDNRYENLIDFEPDLFTNVNRGEVGVRGIEVSANWRAGEMIGLNANLTWQESEVTGAPDELRFRPDWRGGAHLDWQVREGTRLFAQAFHVGERTDSSTPTGTVKLDAYTRIDFNISQHLTDVLVIAVLVRNAGDAAYEEAIGFPAPGRSVQLRLSADW